ncbi:MAG TPA: CBS domain-containing protein [Kofleriaceae bacterium]|nr:CBS domain-containing protein [Kofleriaceae bacterium]
MRVDEIMSVPAYTCHANESLMQAAKLMWDHDCGAIPVVNDKGKLVGMVTDRDISMAAYTQAKSLDEIQVHVAMSKAVVTARPDDAVTELEDLMAIHQIRRVPIIDPAGKPIGIVSLNDLARSSVRTPAKLRVGIAKVIQTLAAICQPRSEPRAAA